jgi:hypothetical protein
MLNVTVIYDSFGLNVLFAKQKKDVFPKKWS